MKIKHLLPACALALPLCASAVPAYPGLLPRTLEDGSTIMVRQNGDEFFNYLTDEQGFLLAPAAGGKLAYRLDPNGARMMATPILLQSLKTEALERLDPEMRRMAENRGPARIAQHDGNGRTTFPTKGDIHYLVVLMQYSDLKWSMDDPATAMNELLNGENYHDNGAVGSMRQYLIDCSHGGLNPTFDIVGPVTLPKTNAYYVGDRYDNIREAVSEAAKAVDDQVDFTKYDYDNDGIIDNIIFFYAGYGGADTEKGVGIWPHNGSAYSANLTLDGKRFGPYCCFNELNGGTHWINKDGVLNGIGTPVHEFGHVMGFPDLYDPDYKVMSTPGDWSVFDSGCYNGDGYAPAAYSAYERYVFGWEEPLELTEPGTYSILASSKGGGSYRVNVYRKNSTIFRNEFFIFETRDNNGWDTFIPGQGMLIWHIDYSQGAFTTSNSVNSVASRNRCRLITADGSALYELGTTSGRAKNAAWPQDIDYITPDTRIKLSYRCIEAPTPRVIPHYFTNIAYDHQTATSTFEYDAITETPDLTTVLHTPLRLEENDRLTNKVRLEWDPVEGAESYLLTLYRVNSQGKIFYENFLDAKDMGLETSYEYNFPSNKMNIEFHASVRVKNKIPALESSNEVVFTPSQLGTTGIEEIAPADEVMPVRGLKGAIDAPADARIFTLSGTPAGRTDLPAGIYIVRCADRSYKVIVK